MPNNSGKSVHFLRMIQGIASVRLSTTGHTIVMLHIGSSAQLGFTPTLSTLLHSAFPLLKSHSPPLSEHYLYPVSTAPTISPSQKKFKER